MLQNDDLNQRKSKIEEDEKKIKQQWEELIKAKNEIKFKTPSVDGHFKD